MSTPSLTDAVSYLVRYVVRMACGMPANSVRPANQLSPVGGQTDEFATVLIMSGGNIGGAALIHVPLTDGSENITEAVEQLYRFTASIQFFRGADVMADPVGLAKWSSNAFDRAVRLGSLLELSAPRELMQRVGLCLIGKGSARDLSALNDAAWESRGSVDLEFCVVGSESAIIANYNQIAIVLAAELPDGTFVTTNVEVTT